MPLIRYNTDDLISTKKTEDTNGALPKFNKILGRNDDVIVLKDGILRDFVEAALERTKHKITYNGNYFNKMNLSEFSKSVYILEIMTTSGIISKKIVNVKRINFI